jgi:hypothetical protein
MRLQKDEENYIMSSLMICTPHQGSGIGGASNGLIWLIRLVNTVINLQVP